MDTEFQFYKIEVRCIGKLKHPQVISRTEENWPEEDSDLIIDIFVRLIVVLNHSVYVYLKIQIAEDQRCERIVKLVQKYKKICAAVIG